MENYYELVEELKTFFNVKSLEEVAERLGYKKIMQIIGGTINNFQLKHWKNTMS